VTTQSPRLDRWLPLGAIVLGALIIGFAAILSKLAMRDGVGTMAVATWRTGMSVPIFALLMYATRPDARVSVQRSAVWLLIPGLAFALDLLTWHAAFNFTTASMSTLLANVSVVFVGLGGWLLLKEYIDWRWWLGAILAMTGVVMLMLDTQTLSTAPNPSLGNSLALLTAVFYASYLLSAKVVRGQRRTFEIMFAVVLVSTVVLGIAATVMGDTWLPATSRGWLWLVLLAVGPQVAGQGLIIWAVGRVPAAFVAVALLLQPISTAIWGDLFLDEPLRVTDIIPGVLVLAGIALARLGTNDRQ
jgi:drug/metabolite transporter (DMT)-like permease